MFFVGLCGLPWLWVVNILYFWDSVYGRLPCLGDALNSNDSHEENAENNGILGFMEDSREEDSDPNGASKSDHCFTDTIFILVTILSY